MSSVLRMTGVLAVMMASVTACQSTPKVDTSAGVISEDNPGGETTVRNSEDTKTLVEPQKADAKPQSGSPANAKGKAKKKASGKK